MTRALVSSIKTLLYSNFGRPIIIILSIHPPALTPMLIFTKFLLTSTLLASTTFVQAAPIHEHEVRQISKWDFQPNDSAVPIWIDPASRGKPNGTTTTTTSTTPSTTTTSSSASGAASGTPDGPATVDNGGATGENNGSDEKPQGVSERSYSTGGVTGW
ncbi:hypothetical protein P691DRAFT_538391 [Macrolepiota fuliginosa MF-IS2]|uniref:Uncharacterized protein n=1 Tax=Macrolepiota fuliginosa MF-IS2 TaxID=1400762 RepID=A0A9P5XIA9_9AGAR|nr:hypothetical protein P691DRAFT_538391 [Macrolepiota fuliginosa MF-IS2]